MADEKQKTLQEQPSPTGPPVSQEVKDMAPAVAQPSEEKDKQTDTKSDELKETEAAGSKRLDDIESRKAHRRTNTTARSRNTMPPKGITSFLYPPSASPLPTE